jgi:hypothetical protein
MPGRPLSVRKRRKSWSDPTVVCAAGDALDAGDADKRERQPHGSDAQAVSAATTVPVATAARSQRFITATFSSDFVARAMAALRRLRFFHELAKADVE